MPSKIITRAEAIAKGLKTYFTRPCKRGHTCFRRVINRCCCECAKQQRFDRRQSDLETARAKDRESKRKYPQKRTPEQNATYVRDRRERDLNFRLRSVLSNRVSAGLKRQGTEKSIGTIELIGCTIEFLNAHLEAQFTEGMTWDNWGKGKRKWNIDHKIPLASFNLTLIEEQKKAFHHSNLQPLWQPQNQSKGAKLDWKKGEPK